MTADQYECETNTSIVKSPGPFNCFDDISKALTYPRRFQNDLNQFLDLLKKMLEVASILRLQMFSTLHSLQ